MEQKEQYLEKTRHGTAMFPVEHYYCSYPAGGAGLPAHWHEEFELTWVKKGSCSYMIGLKPCFVQEGDILFLPSGILHGIPEVRVREFKTDSFVFHPEIFGDRRDICQVKYISPVESGKIHFPTVISGKEAAAEKLREVFAELSESFERKQKGYEMEIKELLFKIMLLFYRFVPYQREEADSEEITEKLKAVLQYVKEHYRQQITVAQLAQICHFSEYYFMRFFKQYMGVTCVEYLNQYRMEIAAGRLAGSSRSVTEIAMDTGFNNVSYFNRVFRRSFGMTPKEYRKSNKGERV